MYFPDFALRAINQEHPGGISPNSLDSFDEIKRQINNLNKVTGEVSWNTVEALSQKILTSHSKDFRCACYFAVAASHTRGLRGLVDGLKVIQDMCLVYWYNGFPTIERTPARLSSFKWFIDHCNQIQQQISLSPDDLPLIESGKEMIVTIEQELRLRYTDKAPDMSCLSTQFQQWHKELQEIQSAARPKKKRLKIGKKAEQSVNSATKAISTKGKLSLLVIFLIIISIVIFYGNDFIKSEKLKNIQNNISSYSIYELNLFTKSINNKTFANKQVLKPALIKRTNEILKDWTQDPKKLNNVDELDTITRNLSRFYPDSSAVKNLRSDFLNNKSSLIDIYKKTAIKFKQARSVFANLKLKNDISSLHERAYQYSNSLFPLLARIQYAEKEHSYTEFIKAQKLLNIYQYKLNSLKKNLVKEN